MDFSSLFVTDTSFSHLNAGTRTRVPLRVLDFMERERREQEKNPTKAMFVGYEKIWTVQKELGAYLGTSPHHIFLRENITSAFNDFLFALPPLGEGEIVATGWEYGGITGLARHWANSCGLAFRTVPLPFRADWDASGLCRELVGSLTPRTRILLISHVATCNGAIFPIKEIAMAARDRGIITLIDGAHAVGAIPTRLDELDADFYGGNFHKWFLGPEGTGFGWIHPRWEGRLSWKFGGWASERPPTFYQGFGDKNPETCRRLLPGTFDRVRFLGLGETLAFRRDWGEEILISHQKALRDKALEAGLQAGWVVKSPTRFTEQMLGPLVCFERPSRWAGESSDLATRLLREVKVQVALPEVQGEPLIRLSPGLYSRPGEVEEGMKALTLFGAH